MVKSSFQNISISENPLHLELIKCLEKFPKRIALVNGETDEQVSYEKLITNSKKVANILNLAGIKNKDIVGIFAPNSVEYIYSLIGLMFNGAVSAFVNPIYTDYELDNAANLLRSRTWVTAKQLYPKLIECAKRIKLDLFKIILIDWKGPLADLPPNTVAFNHLLNEEPSKNQNNNCSYLFPSTSNSGIPNFEAYINSKSISDNSKIIPLNVINKPTVYHGTELTQTLSNDSEEYFTNDPCSNDSQNICMNVNVNACMDVNVNFCLDVNVKSDPVFIFFSSGTTSLPKGVMSSHYSILSMLTILNYFHGVNDATHEPDEQPVSLMILPAFHIYGLVGVLLFALMSNYKLVILQRFIPDLTLACINKYQVTIFTMAPSVQMFLIKSPLCSKYNLTSIRRVMCGSAPLSTETVQDFKRAFNLNKFCQIYGMTEMCLATLNTKDVPEKNGSAGLVVPNHEIIVKCLKTDRILEPNEPGELWIRGPCMMLGYFKNRKATDEIIEKDGWIKTGDIGYYDDDGYFYIVDRIKELIKYKGFQVAPAELELLILTHQIVTDVAVIGVLDEEAGEVPKAFVVKKINSSLTEEDIITFVAKHVSSYKHLRGGVQFLESIPRNSSGKIMRRLLRAKYLKKSINQLGKFNDLTILNERDKIISKL